MFGNLGRTIYIERERGREPKRESERERDRQSERESKRESERQRKRDGLHNCSENERSEVQRERERGTASQQLYRNRAWEGSPETQGGRASERAREGERGRSDITNMYHRYRGTAGREMGERERERPCALGY